MSYRVEVEDRAARQIHNLQPPTQRRVLDQLEALQADPRPPGCKKLKGRTLPAWRVRLGDYPYYTACTTMRSWCASTASFAATKRTENDCRALSGIH